MKRIYQKLAAATAASAAIGFAACPTPPASAATFEMGVPESSFYIRFSGTVNFTFENLIGTMGLDGLDTFQATYRYLYEGTREEARWGKNDLSRFSFYYSPQSLYVAPENRPRPFDRGIAPLALEAINQRGEKLFMMTESRGYTSVNIPKDCPPWAPPGYVSCPVFRDFRTGWRSVRQIDDDPPSVPIPEPTVIPGLMLGIGWLIKKKQASGVKVGS